MKIIKLFTLTLGLCAANFHNAQPMFDDAIAPKPNKNQAVYNLVNEAYKTLDYEKMITLIQSAETGAELKVIFFAMKVSSCLLENDGKYWAEADGHFLSNNYLELYFQLSKIDPNTNFTPKFLSEYLENFALFFKKSMKNILPISQMKKAFLELKTNFDDQNSLKEINYFNQSLEVLCSFKEIKEVLTQKKYKQHLELMKNRINLTSQFLNRYFVKHNFQSTVTVVIETKKNEIDE